MSLLPSPLLVLFLALSSRAATLNKKVKVADSDATLQVSSHSLSPSTSTASHLVDCFGKDECSIASQ